MTNPMTAPMTPPAPDTTPYRTPAEPGPPAVRMVEMRCSTAGCHHPMSIHEALEGPCHHGESSGQRCGCQAYGGGAFTPKAHGAADALPQLPIRPLSPSSQPVRGPSPVTAALEDEAAARLAARRQAQVEQDAADAQREGQVERPVDVASRLLETLPDAPLPAIRHHRHRFPLRRGMFVEIELPEDVTVGEAYRLSNWIRTLVIKES